MSGGLGRLVLAFLDYGPSGGKLAAYLCVEIACQAVAFAVASAAAPLKGGRKVEPGICSVKGGRLNGEMELQQYGALGCWW